MSFTFLAGKVGSAASALGQYLAPHIQRGGTKLLSSTTKLSPEEASTKVETFLGATASAVQGIGTVYSGLETAASILGRSLSNNTVQIIEYKCVLKIKLLFFNLKFFQVWKAGGRSWRRCYFGCGQLVHNSW